MRLLSIVILLVLATLDVGCKHRRKPPAPAWASVAPTRCEAAVSGQASWILEEPQFQAQLAKFPMAEQSLDLFLKKAHISPHGETGRVSLFVMDPILDLTSRKVPVQTSSFLLQFHGFKDPKSLQTAVAESFPIEGSLQLQGNDLPLHVVMDINQAHIRILTDLEGNLWLGDLSALTSLGSQGLLPKHHPVLSAVAWIDGSAPVQGFVRPESILSQISGQIPADINRELPRGVECLAWSVAPAGGGDQPLYAVQISITGSPEGIVQAASWMQRIVAIATSLRTGSAPPPDLLQERTRALLRCHLSWDQVTQVLSKLSQPNLLPAPKKKGNTR